MVDVMPGVTLREALELPTFRRAAPEVVAGAAGTGRAIRWVHATERPDVRQLLREGDLLLTMGTGLPGDDDAAGLVSFVDELADVGSAGVVVELGRRWGSALPDALVGACERHGVPLVVLARETRFAALAQEIGERVVDRQLAELREAQRVHETFTELSNELAGPVDVLRAVQRLADAPVVVENAQHRPLDYFAGPDEGDGFLDGWPARSRRVEVAGRTGWDPANGWLVTRLGTTDRSWGRLVIGSPEAPSQRLVAVAERAASALALHRLHDRDRGTLMRRTHLELLTGLGEEPGSDDVRRRCELAGFPVHRRGLTGVVVRGRVGAVPQVDLDEVAATVVRAAHALRLPALVSEVERDLRVLVSTSPGADADDLVDRLAARVLAHHDVVVAAGRTAPDRTGVARTVAEAGQVADAAPQARREQDPDVHRLADLHLRGLLALLGEDERVRLFVERELGPLQEHDRADGSRTDLLAALRALVLHPSSKTEAAASLHLSRAAFYDRLARIESILDADLDDPDVRVSLHVAVVADELFGGRAK
ncbi:PucR family transcriptional regulator ligand-binding domain-containing protein [Nocardioides sp. STR2]|uniref:PucR family transcriptional regulator ligand-binding domain-containing protein n=1 Tax=Nocardioides pini TaxID=2975053 RepID=A0ABT4C7C3_9ACTN|nr:PucR family transcriptional regulator ligand-binding domain-containing protein [Nocardioides pini]MCY4724726.1 PucR family transcriptional regulator ligand-binding domain-containing protein [Nocardioides pini]